MIREHYIKLQNFRISSTMPYQAEHIKLFFLWHHLSVRLLNIWNLEGIEKGFERLIVENHLERILKTASRPTRTGRNFWGRANFLPDRPLSSKEMIQSIFALRFANLIFENIWTGDYIDNVQITFAERLGSRRTWWHRWIRCPPRHGPKPYPSTAFS